MVSLDFDTRPNSFLGPGYFMFSGGFLTKITCFVPEGKTSAMFLKHVQEKFIWGKYSDS